MYLCPLQLSCIYPFSPLSLACGIRLYIASNRQFQNIPVGFCGRMIKNCHVLDRDRFVNIAVPPLPELPNHKFHLRAIRLNRKKIPLKNPFCGFVRILPESCDLCESGCSRDDVQHWDSRWALLYLDFPINSGTRAFGWREIIQQFYIILLLEVEHKQWIQKHLNQDHQPLLRWFCAVNSNSILKCLKYLTQLCDHLSCLTCDNSAESSEKSLDCVTLAQWHGYLSSLSWHRYFSSWFFAYWLFYSAKLTVVWWWC